MRETKQRSLILDIINDSQEHLTADAIYKLARNKIPNISLGTVYRNLNLLFTNGNIRKIKTDDGVEHYDNVKAFHNHFICMNCNHIYDIFDDEYKSKKINLGIVINYEVVYKGICKCCIEEEK